MKPLNVVVLINSSSGSVAGKDESIRNELSAGFALHGISAEFQFLQAGQLKAAAEMARVRLLSSTGGQLNARSVLQTNSLAYSQ